MPVSFSSVGPNACPKEVKDDEARAGKRGVGS